MQVLIHIGYHKTGSTWLQQELFVSHNNVFEPLSLNTKGHSTLTDSFIKDKNKYLLSSFDDNQVIIKEEIDNILKIKGRVFNEKIPVISSERLSGNPHSGGFDACIIAERLRKVFPEGKVLIVIREQKSFILSHYFQYINQGGMLGIKKYLQRKYDGRIPFFTPSHINYLLPVQYYFKLFGKENVLVLPYELFKENPEAFFNHLENFINREIEIDKSSFLKFWNQRDNYWLRYHFRFLNLFRKNTSVNPYYLFGNRYLDLLINYFIISFGKVIREKRNEILIKKISRTIDDFVIRYCNYAESNKELGKLIGTDLSRYGYY